MIALLSFWLLGWLVGDRCVSEMLAQFKTSVKRCGYRPEQLSTPEEATVACISQHGLPRQEASRLLDTRSNLNARANAAKRESENVRLLWEPTEAVSRCCCCVGSIKEDGRWNVLVGHAVLLGEAAGQVVHVAGNVHLIKEIII